MIILGLGSNLNNKIDYIKQSIDLIRSDVLSNVKLSPLYQSPALLPENAPKDWNIPFINMAIMGATSLSPQQLLSKIKKIEQVIGRKHRGIWGPREIDIDILAYHTDIVSSDSLQIPHLHLAKRSFALVPFADLAPDWIHPILHQSASALAQTLLAKEPSILHKLDFTL